MIVSAFGRLLFVGVLAAGVGDTPIGPAIDRTDDPAELLVEANHAYDESRYAEAVVMYETLIRSGADSGLLYYNLGNAYLRSNRVGRAIAAFRVAQSRRPRDQDINANLAFSRKLTKDAIAPAETPTVLRTLFFWHFSFSRRELVIILLVTNLLFWGALALLHRRRDSELLRWATIGLLLVLLCVGISTGLRTVWPQRIAVTQLHELDVHSGTSTDTVVRFKLHEGTEARVVDVEGDWVRIALPDGEQGWVARDGVAVLSF